MMPTAQEMLALADVAVCLPLTLIINFSLFQYLVTTFWKRRHERRVRLLLGIAALSFVSVIPFAFPDPELTRNLNDMPEVSSTLTFLLQITILTRDVGKRIKIRSLWALAWAGELLVALSLLVLLTNIVDIVAPVIDMSLVEELDNIVENALPQGLGLCYVLCLTHEYPFDVLNHVTGWSWEHVQGVWMRVTIVLSLWMTVKTRLHSQSSKHGPTTTHGGRGGAGPSHGSVFERQLQPPEKSRPIKATSIVKPTPSAHKASTSAPTARSIVSVVPHASRHVVGSRSPDAVETFTHE